MTCLTLMMNLRRKAAPQWRTRSLRTTSCSLNVMRRRTCPTLATAPLVPPQTVVQPMAQAHLAVASPPPDALLSAQANEAVSTAFNNLAGSILAGSQRTLDDIVKDMMRPMLKVWLDDNLPSIVERLVRAEIERVARGGR